MGFEGLIVDDSQCTAMAFTDGEGVLPGLGTTVQCVPDTIKLHISTTQNPTCKSEWKENGNVCSEYGMTNILLNTDDELLPQLWCGS